MKKHYKYICSRCGGDMKPGIALQDIIGGAPDFGPNDIVCTMSPTGMAIIINCLKCINCGHSKNE